MKNVNFTKDQAIIGGLPMPPSTNGLYSSFTRNGKVYRVPSPEYKSYKKQMEKWRFVNNSVLRDLKHWIEFTAWNYDLKAKKLYRFDRYYCFPHSKIWTKAGKPKKLDATNRIKAFDDLFCTMMGIDDSHVWSGLAEKVTISEEWKPCVILKIRPVKARSWDQFKETLHLNLDT